MYVKMTFCMTDYGKLNEMSQLFWSFEYLTFSWWHCCVALGGMALMKELCPQRWDLKV